MINLSLVYAGIRRELHTLKGELKKVKTSPNAKKHQGFSYRAMQDRNTTIFYAFSKKKREELKSKGYNNRGWNNVIQSWELMNQLVNL